MANAQEKIPALSPNEFQKEIIGGKNIYVLDVRTPQEYAQGHIKGAHLLDWFDHELFKTEAKRINKKDTILLYCRSGRRSNDAAHYLQSLGYTVVELKGGTMAWEESGLPLIR